MTDASGVIITKQLLKSRSGEFDVECIHTLDLKEMDIADLGCLGECAGLQHLNLSRNDISRLYGLAGLTNLVNLNLSANRISVLEGLQSLDNLKMLNLAGNLIGRYHKKLEIVEDFIRICMNKEFHPLLIDLLEMSNVDALQCVTGLEKLSELHLQNKAEDLSNPLCVNVKYKTSVLAILPNLRILDGELLYGRGSELYKICAEIDEALQDATGLKHTKELRAPEPWVTAEFWEKKSDQFESSILCDSDKQLEDLLAECRSISTKAEETITEAKRKIEAKHSD